MTDWSRTELNAIAAADELRVTTARRDGSLRRAVPVWVVADGDDLYLRSAYGRRSAWYRGALARPHGHITAGGVDRDVTFTHVGDEAVNSRLDAAYRNKYHRYGASYVDPMVVAPARDATLKLTPR